MRRSSTFVRRVYDKLVITLGMEVKTGSAGLTQYVKDGLFSPDHSVSPLVLAPTVQAKAADVTPELQWSVGIDADNAGIGGTAWKVDGEAINTVWTEGTDYELEDNGKELWIYKNIPVDSGVNITCAILVYDSRTGVTIPVETDPVPLATVAVADAPYRLSLDHDNVLWDVTADDLWEWDYRNARGYAQKMTKAEAENDACYKKQVNFCATKGSGQLNKGYGIWINDSSDKTVAYITASGKSVNNQPVKILELTTTSVTFDCRTIQDELFKVYLLDADGAIMKDTLNTIHVKTTYRDYDAPEIVNHCDYTTRQKKYRNSLRVRCNGEEWDYPECWLDIKWGTKARTTGAEEVEVGAGNDCVFNPNEAGGGVTPTDNGFDMIADTDYLPVLSVATDGTDTYVDEEGNVLLI